MDQGYRIWGRPMYARKAKMAFASMALVIVMACALLSHRDNVPSENTEGTSQGWKEEFNLSGRKLSDRGEARYFVLIPGFQATLESRNARLVITVLNETKVIGGITTRVVEEKEIQNERLSEVSRNFYAIDLETEDAFYFGEEVESYENGEIAGHEGAWLAFEGDNRPGLIVPGNPEVGMKYYQELAPGVAMDRAEVVSISETFRTPAGKFKNCLVTEETSKIEPARERKTYCPGIGLVQDQSLLLVSYGKNE